MVLCVRYSSLCGYLMLAVSHACSSPCILHVPFIWSFVLLLMYTLSVVVVAVARTCRARRKQTRTGTGCARDVPRCHVVAGHVAPDKQHRIGHPVSLKTKTAARIVQKQKGGPKPNTGTNCNTTCRSELAYERRSSFPSLCGATCVPNIDPQLLMRGVMCPNDSCLPRKTRTRTGCGNAVSVRRLAEHGAAVEQQASRDWLL